MGPMRLRRRRRGGACWPFAHEAAPILGQIDHHAGQGTYRWHLARSTRRARMMISQAHADCSGRRRDRYAGQLRERAPFRSLFGRASLSKKALRHASLSKKALACLHGRHGRSRLDDGCAHSSIAFERTQRPEHAASQIAARLRTTKPSLYADYQVWTRWTLSKFNSCVKRFHDLRL